MIQDKTFIICEVGSNWSSLEDCLTSISQAKACGADAVKFQAYDYGSLYGPRLELGVNIHQMPIPWLPKLAEKSTAVGIKFMCSAFSPKLFREVDKYVSIHKIASSEACHIELLDEAKKAAQPVIISFGAHSDADIGIVLRYMEGTKVYPLYCVPEYPARTVDFQEFMRLRDKFRTFEWGYSDHTLDAVEIPRRAVQLGAGIIEKHVNFVGVTSPDSPHSLNTAEFMTMCKAIRGETYSLPVSKDEQQMMLRHKRRIIATQDIRPGDTLIWGENYGIYRSLKDDVKAAHPFAAVEMNGCTCKVDIKAGDGISLMDV